MADAAIRRRRMLGVAAVLGTVASLAAGVPARAAVPDGFVGMTSEDALAGTPAYRARHMAQMELSGITLLRQTFDWSVVERRRGRLDFSFYDGFVAAAAQHGIRVMPILFNAPRHRSTRPAKRALRGTYPPKKASEFARFARAAARRYGPGGAFWREHPSIPARPIQAWQIWNEPNLDVYWQPKSRATAYVRLLRASAKAIRAVDPAAEIVSAGIPDSRSGIRMTPFIRQMLKAGAGRSMDTLAVNPYATSPAGVIGILRRARGALDRRGATGIAIRATELGWADRGPRSKYTVGASRQAANIKSLIGRLGAQRGSLRLRGFVYFNWRDARPYAGFRDFWGLHTGLLTLQGRKKPAFNAFRAAVTALGGPAGATRRGAG